MTKARNNRAFLRGGSQRARFVRGSNPATHTLTGVNIMQDTEKAVLAELSADVAIWLPKSQIKSSELEENGKTYKIVITEWIAKQKGLLE